MTVIFPGGDFFDFILKTVIKNNSLAGNIPVIKSFLFSFLCVGRRGEGRREGRGRGREPIAVHLPCARSHSNASMLAGVLVDRFFPQCLVEEKKEEKEKEKEQEQEHEQEQEQEHEQEKEQEEKKKKKKSEKER